MIRVKMMRGNETAIIDNGKSYVFGLDGKCRAEDAGNLVSYMDGALDLPLISLLSSNGVPEIGVSMPGQELVRYKPNLYGTDCALAIMTFGGYIKMLQRAGEQHGVRFNQIIFIYREDYDLSGLMRKLELTRL